MIEMEELWDVSNAAETLKIINDPILFNTSRIDRDRPNYSNINRKLANKSLN